jgi:predicted dinucleotide-binding enzyme
MSYAIIGFGNIGQALAKAFARSAGDAAHKLPRSVRQLGRVDVA